MLPSPALQYHMLYRLLYIALVFLDWTTVLTLTYRAIYLLFKRLSTILNPLTPNDPYRGRTAPLTSKRCVLCIYSTNIDAEYFKQGIYSPFFSLQNSVCFIILTYLFPVLFTFYIQDVLKFKKNSGAKRLNLLSSLKTKISLRNKLYRPEAYFMYHQLSHSKILCSSHIAFVCFV